MSKRVSIVLPDFYGQRKKLKGNHSISSGNCLGKNELFECLPTDTEAGLIYLKNRVFPLTKFEDMLPPILLVNQVYTIISNKTAVDKELNLLQSKGVIRVFKLVGAETVLVVIFFKDLTEHVIKHCPEKPVINRFLKILPQVQDVIVEKRFLREELGFLEQEISDLVGCGMLTLRSAASYWLSFPNSGEFLRIYFKGRKSVLGTIKKSKFSEILQPELEDRNLDKSVKLGIKYHIHDLIGAELVKWARQIDVSPPTESSSPSNVSSGAESRGMLAPRVEVRGCS
uniref:Serine/threonine-protein kinase 19 n=1 Tax=Timema poppense TaxID=170557 RepID=A0A7R9D1C6_TIMPO|nr:unnamed protein product [Timema poppensis]